MSIQSSPGSLIHLIPRQDHFETSLKNLQYAQEKLRVKIYQLGEGMSKSNDISSICLGYEDFYRITFQLLNKCLEELVNAAGKYQLEKVVELCEKGREAWRQVTCVDSKMKEVFDEVFNSKSSEKKEASSSEEGIHIKSKMQAYLTLASVKLRQAHLTGLLTSPHPNSVENLTNYINNLNSAEKDILEIINRKAEQDIEGVDREIEDINKVLDQEEKGIKEIKSTNATANILHLPFARHRNFSLEDLKDSMREELSKLNAIISRIPARSIFYPILEEQLIVENYQTLSNQCIDFCNAADAALDKCLEEMRDCICLSNESKMQVLESTSRYINHSVKDALNSTFKILKKAEGSRRYDDFSAEINIRSRKEEILALGALIASKRAQALLAWKFIEGPSYMRSYVRGVLEMGDFLFLEQKKIQSYLTRFFPERLQSSPILEETSESKSETDDGSMVSGDSRTYRSRISELEQLLSNVKTLKREIRNFK